MLRTADDATTSGSPPHCRVFSLVRRAIISFFTFSARMRVVRAEQRCARYRIRRHYQHAAWCCTACSSLLVVAAEPPTFDFIDERRLAAAATAGDDLASMLQYHIARMRPAGDCASRSHRVSSCVCARRGWPTIRRQRAPSAYAGVGDGCSAPTSRCWWSAIRARESDFQVCCGRDCRRGACVTILTCEVSDTMSLPSSRTMRGERAKSSDFQVER